MNSNAKKVADITLAFWIMKICVTTLGETAGDLLSMTLNIGYATSNSTVNGCNATINWTSRDMGYGKYEI